MTLTVYAWVLGVALVACGGALVGRGWWLDKAAGNHKRARCRRCWYSLEGIAAREDGVTVCPECGALARRARDMHRVRRYWWAVAAGLAMLGGGVFLCGKPVLEGGRWLYLLPRSVAARLWSWAGAEGYGRDIRARMAQGTATEEEIESVMGGAKSLVLRAAKGAAAGPGVAAPVSGNEVAAAFTALAKKPPDPEVERAAGTLMVENMPFLSQPAVKYLVGMGVPMERRIEMADAALSSRKGLVFPQEYLKMLTEAADNPAAIDALVRMASGPRSMQLTSWARSSLMSADEAGVKGVMTAFRAAKTLPERAKLFELFVQVAPYHLTPAATPFVIEVLGVPELRMKANEFLVQNHDRLEISQVQIGEWLRSGDAARADVGLEIVGMMGGESLPEGCGALVLKRLDAGDSVPRQALFHFSGSDQKLWVARLNGGTPESRRDACMVVASYGSRVEGAVAALRKIEGDAQETEEMRVAARDALRQLGVWEGK